MPGQKLLLYHVSSVKVLTRFSPRVRQEAPALGRSASTPARMEGCKPLNPLARTRVDQSVEMNKAGMGVWMWRVRYNGCE